MSTTNEDWEPFGDTERGSGRSKGCWGSLWGDDDTAASSHAPSDEGRGGRRASHGRDPEASHSSEETPTTDNATREGALPHRDNPRGVDEPGWGDFARAFFTMGLLPLYMEIHDRNKPPEERKKKTRKYTMVALIGFLASISTIGGLVLAILAATDAWPKDDGDWTNVTNPELVPQLKVEHDYEKKYCVDCPSLCEQLSPRENCVDICKVRLPCSEAAIGNQYPVLLKLSVTDGGNPVNSLGFDNFHLTGTALPGSPGARFGFCNGALCLASLQDAASGEYRLPILPASFEHWSPGKYSGKVTVGKDGYDDGSADIEFEIREPEPPGPSVRDTITLLTSVDTSICAHASGDQCDAQGHSQVVASAKKKQSDFPVNSRGEKWRASNQSFSG